MHGSGQGAELRLRCGHHGGHLLPVPDIGLEDHGPAALGLDGGDNLVGLGQT